MARPNPLKTAFEMYNLGLDYNRKSCRCEGPASREASNMSGSGCEQISRFRGQERCRKVS